MTSLSIFLFDILSFGRHDVNRDFVVSLRERTNGLLFHIGVFRVRGGHLFFPSVYSLILACVVAKGVHTRRSFRCTYVIAFFGVLRGSFHMSLGVAMICVHCLRSVSCIALVLT